MHPKDDPMPDQLEEALIQRAFDAGRQAGRSEVWHVEPTETKGEAVAFIGALATDNAERAKQAFLDAAALAALGMYVVAHADSPARGIALAYNVAEALWAERERRRT